MGGRLGAAIGVTIGLLALARTAGAETIDLQCSIGSGGPPAIVHLNLDALTAQIIEGRYPTLDAQKYQIEQAEPEVRWRIRWAMGHSIYRYNRTLNVIEETYQGEYGSPYNYTWPCVKTPAKP